MGFKVGVVGATGAVGLTMLEVLAEQQFPVDELRLFATQRQAGRTLAFGGRDVPVTLLGPGCYDGLDLVLFSAGAELAREECPKVAAAGGLAVDNSNAFRMEPGVPLVVPEVNAHRIREHKGIIANPNCTTAQLVVALAPLHREAQLERLMVASYQSVSGTGLPAMEELAAQSRARLAREEEPAPRVYPHPIAFNLLPHIDQFDADGNTLEEMKVVRETRKIMELPHLPVSATCVRVPVMVSHGEAVHCAFRRRLSPDRARELLAGAPGLVVVDDPSRALYPLPRDAEGKDPVFVGRIRADTGLPRGLALWVVADNLRKGAATNAVQIAQIALGLVEAPDTGQRPSRTAKRMAGA